MGTRGSLVRLASVLVAAAALVGAGCSSDGGGASADTTSTTAGTPGSSGGEPAGTFTLLSYNVAGLPQEISDEHPSTNLPLISPKLAEFDVVATQEDFDWWAELASGFDFVHYHERLRAEAGHPHRSPQHPGPDAVDLDLSDRPSPEVGDGLGVLSRFPLRGDERVPWTGCFGGMDTSDGGAGDCLAMKGFQRTTLVLADGKLVDLYNLHGEAGRTDRDQALQVEDYRQLAAHIVAHSEGRAVIVAGDTNLHTGGDHPDGRSGADTEIWERFLADAGLTDACAAADCPSPERIDKVAFRSGGGVGLEVTGHRFRAEDFVDDAGEPLSDHDPLEVTFAWR